MSFLIMMLYLLFDTWALIAFQLVLIPQIISLAYYGQKPRFSDIITICVLVLLNTFNPAYFRGCPKNFLQVQNDQYNIIWIGLMIFVQFFVLFLQYMLGCRFFIPKCFLPQKFNYYVQYTFEQDQEKGIETCNICLQEFFELQPQDQLQANSNQVGITDKFLPQFNNNINTSKQALLKKPKSIKIMKTPCGHQFHQECLKAWLNQKLECPNCRKGLPVLD